ncbi:25.3 kDa vesicle transport protein SEC22-1 [Spinacia oleracea]|uniref:25.3 kDa vesicle transport protein SEC22-1 n=1 Tax=Spinacia oleracea TaxID=3562 RepID=A0A9R0JPT5_SPIOL|nr:25.3 kDa vesicle transport protein SEC22-1 [Spinacia oleracea]
MVKLTIIGRIRDGMPLAQGLRYVNEDYNNIPLYKQQAEFILKEISRGSLEFNHPKMTIRLDHQHSFNCLVACGVCFITLCDSTYPRTLAFHYLDDLRQELEKFQSDDQLVEKVTRPYSFVKFDSVISNIRKQYVDTRTQANLRKLNANRGQELDIKIETMCSIIENRKQLDYMERVVMAPQIVSPIWGSRRLEIIALKWTPIGISISVVVTLLLWASLIMADYVVLCS